MSANGSQTNFCIFVPMIKVRATKIINNQQNRKLNPTPLKRNINKVSNSIRKKFNIAYQY
jgi:hypothetical protein